MIRVARLAAMLAVFALLVPAAPAWAACPKTSLPAIEDEVMCPICGVPLANAGGPQAEHEREYIRDHVDACQSKRQIKDALVAEYGEEVLAMPGSSGFDLAAYLVPAGGLLLAALALAAGALRWRRGRDDDDAAGLGAGAESAGHAGPGEPPAGADLDKDLQRYDL